MLRTNRRITAIVALSVASLLASGCGIFKDRSKEYLKSGNIPVMTVPANKDGSALGQLYHIPDVSNSALTGDEHDTPRPLPLSETRLEETVKIQTYESESWILINKPPEEVWPRVRNVLSRSSVPATRVDASRGEIDTTWLQFQDDEINRHRFRIRIEPAVQLNSTEVKILHSESSIAEIKDTTPWPDSSDALEREREMLEMLANALTTDISSGTISLLAQSIGGESKVEMVTPRVAAPYLVLKLPYDRSWASLVYSLSRGGFSILEQNKSSGTVRVEYATTDEDDKAEEPGFFGRLFGAEAVIEPPMMYQVTIQQAERGAEVRIVEPDKSSLDNATATKLLKIIRSNLT